MRIKDFQPLRELAAGFAFAALFAIGVVYGFWDFLAVGSLLLFVALGKLVRRIEWRGRAILPRSLAEPDAKQGWLAQPRDMLILILIIVALPVTSLTLAVVLNTPATWIGAGLGAVVTLWASIALLLEIRLRRREREQV